MNKRILFVVLAVCLTGTFTSCGDKNEKAINKYEKLVKKANEESDPEKKSMILIDAAKVVKDLKEDELTEEQKERLVKISMEAAESSYGSMDFE